MNTKKVKKINYQKKMNNSHYRFRYNPENKPHGHGFDVDVSEEFLEFARRQSVNKKGYEAVAEEAYRMFGFESSIEHYKESGFCHWEGESGLLHYVVVPGSAASICLEEDDIHGSFYYSHNIDNPRQTLILFSVILHYLEDIESRILDWDGEK